MGDSVGREAEVDVTNIAHGGSGVARLDGRVVFVPDTIPGERVLVRIADDSRPAFWRAEAVRVLVASPHRRPHVWPEADIDRDPGERPGGADLGHIAIGHQRELKSRLLAEALERHARIEHPLVPVEPLPGEPDGTGWRTRERLHVDRAGRVGPFAARSHEVVEVASLPLALDAVRAAAPLDHRMPGAESLQVLVPSGDGAARLIIDRQAPTVIRERVGDREFRLDDTGFWQVHASAPVALSAAVQESIDPSLADPQAANLDLYGGVGLLAAAVADRLGPRTRITTVESDPRATEHAAENLAEWVGSSAVSARVERWVGGLADASPVERARIRAATVVLDPPRSGAGRAVLEPLAAAGPAQLVYVACDPVAFARDAGLLAGWGYVLVGLRALDLFPNTSHLEVVGAFRRAA